MNLWLHKLQMDGFYKPSVQIYIFFPLALQESCILEDMNYESISVPVIWTERLYTIGFYHLITLNLHFILEMTRAEQGCQNCSCSVVLKYTVEHLCMYCLFASLSELFSLF